MTQAMLRCPPLLVSATRMTRTRPWGKKNWNDVSSVENQLLTNVVSYANVVELCSSSHPEKGAGWYKRSIFDY